MQKGRPGQVMSQGKRKVVVVQMQAVEDYSVEDEDI
jgi:DUF971 family protein